MCDFCVVVEEVKGVGMKPSIRLDAAEKERERIIQELLDQNIIRRCAATNKLVAFNTHGTKVVYIKNLEVDSE